MRFTSTLGVCLATALATAPALAHDESTGGPTNVVENWRDNFVPFFDAGDPKTRYDQDPDNDQSRDDRETRRSAQRWRDEVRTDGSVGEVGDGCMETYCTAVADQNGDIVRMDHTATIGPSTRPGDRNAVVVDVLGAGAEVNLGDADSVGPLRPPTVTEAEVSTDTEMDDQSDRPPPDEIHFATAGDHSLLGAAHSNSEHQTGSESNHDSHGGAIYTSVYAPRDGDFARARDSHIGILVLDHLGCTFGCSDEYHEFYLLDAERTGYQVREMPDQAEFVARDPDRWIFGFTPQPPDRFNSPTEPATTSLFDEVVNPYVDPAVDQAVGVGPLSSVCCAPKPCKVFDEETGDCIDPDPWVGRSCNPRTAANVQEIPDRQNLAGCVEADADNCFGGGSVGGEPNGCFIVDGQPYVHGEPATLEECNDAAVDGCCDSGACW